MFGMISKVQPIATPSTLQIDSALGSGIDWPVGETYTMTVTGTVTEKRDDGGYTLSVSEVSEQEAPEEDIVEESEEITEEEPSRGPGRSAVMSILGK